MLKLVLALEKKQQFLKLKKAGKTQRQTDRKTERQTDREIERERKRERE